MRTNGRFSLIVAALLGGAAVHFSLYACGRAMSSPDGAVHDTAIPDIAIDQAMAETPPPPSLTITEWELYAPKLTGAMTGNEIASQTTSGMWRRVGDTIELRITTAFSGTPTGSCDDFWIWSLPPGVFVDPLKSFGIAGVGNAHLEGIRNVKLHTFAATGSGIAAEADTECRVNATAPFAFNASTSVRINAAVPISGWFAN